MDNQFLDNFGEPVDLNEVLSHWLTTQQALDYLVAREIEMSVSGIKGAIRLKRLRAFKSGTTYRGQWYIDPESLEEFGKYQRN